MYMATKCKDRVFNSTNFISYQTGMNEGFLHKGANGIQPGCVKFWNNKGYAWQSSETDSLVFSMEIH